MPGSSRAAARREEIIAACRKLYEEKPYQSITIKDIGSLTSCTRTSIYSYFETKEEIFLALVQQEYERFTQDLRALHTGPVRSPAGFTSELAHALERRPVLLGLLSRNLYDMEEQSRPERLVACKLALRDATAALCECIARFCPHLDETRRQRFLRLLLPFVYGLYPYTHFTEKQAEAMREAGIPAPEKTLYELAFEFIYELIK